MRASHKLGANYRGRCATCCCLLAVWSVAAYSTAAPPVVPLAPPYYSFDLASPTVIDGTVDADAMLELGPDGPRVAVPGSALGLGAPGDELDALSMAGAGPALTDLIVFLFSVDRATVGVAGPDAVLVGLHVPYNVTDQAAKGQAAGDQFMTTSLFTIAGGLQTNGRDITALNNVLIRNNYDEGGTDFGGEPPTSAKDDAGGAPQDDVDSTTESPPAARVGEVVNVTFSASGESPSLQTLSMPTGVPPSGANIFFNANPLNTPSESTLFASFADLGPQATDDIDAMIVIDGNGDGLFNDVDVILFSLTQSSPSLGSIPGTSADGGAADIFVVVPGIPPAVLASAATLGLGQPTDNVDALGYLLCDDAITCAALHGIRAQDVPAMSRWGAAVLVLLTIVAGAVIITRRSPGRAD
ncbi:MAG: hypothetical protein ACE5HE_12760 [Phycisphaerae bacterium]